MKTMFYFIQSFSLELLVTLQMVSLSSSHCRYFTVVPSLENQQNTLREPGKMNMVGVVLPIYNYMSKMFA